MRYSKELKVHRGYRIVHVLTGRYSMYVLFKLTVLHKPEILEQWNQPSIDFYEKKLGATAMSEWMGMRLVGEGITKLKQFAL